MKVALVGTRAGLVPLAMRRTNTLTQSLRYQSSGEVPSSDKASSPPDETSKPHEIVPKELISGAPNDLMTDRIVRIYKEAKSATQSGANNTKFWRMDWDILGKANRWENDMMGYQGSSDYMQGTRLSFDTQDAAIKFAEGQGWNYYIQAPKARKFRKKDYSANFLHSSGPLKHIRTK